MCFALFLGTRTPAPLIPFAKECPAFFTELPFGGRVPPPGAFTLPHITYVGSDEGCGCGFRNLGRVGDDWVSVGTVMSWPGFDPAKTQPNHEDLAALIRRHFSAEPFVELYGGWEGQLSKPVLAREEIPLAEILEPHFHFRVQGFYRVLP
jgi:hypothetical protein